MKKFELTTEFITVFGIKLFRIRALVAFGDVEVGDLGGFVEKEENLSHNNRAWVYGDAWVSGNARVSGDAEVYGDAWVSGDAEVYGDARVSGDAEVYGDAWVSGNARVSGDAEVYGDAWVYGDARVSGNAEVYGNARVSGNAWVYGNAEVLKKTHLFQVGALGSRNGFTTFFRTKNKEIFVTCGCFKGNIDKFEKAVEETHGGTKHEQTYKTAIALAKLQIDLED